jgi:hypothetical protein
MSIVKELSYISLVDHISKLNLAFDGSHHIHGISILGIILIAFVNNS